MPVDDIDADGDDNYRFNKAVYRMEIKDLWSLPPTTFRGPVAKSLHLSVPRSPTL